MSFISILVHRRYQKPRIFFILIRRKFDPPLKKNVVQCQNVDGRSLMECDDCSNARSINRCSPRRSQSNFCVAAKFLSRPWLTANRIAIELRSNFNRTMTRTRGWTQNCNSTLRCVFFCFFLLQRIFIRSGVAGFSAVLLERAVSVTVCAGLKDTGFTDDKSAVGATIAVGRQTRSVALVIALAVW